MNPVRRISLIELTTEHLRTGLQAGRWSGSLPGEPRLAKELDVGRGTIRNALRQLEVEGVLTGNGQGRSRGIAAGGAAGAGAPPLRVGILRHDVRLTDNLQTSLVLTEIMHSLEAAGHRVFFCKKSQIELKHEVSRLTRQLVECRADTWVVEAGSRPLLEWCASQQTPCLALYGRAEGLPLASTGLDPVPVTRAATRHLLALGHRRIVLIVREAHRKPTPGRPERAFLEELAAHGVVTGDYHLPNWEESPAGFSGLLERLFRHSPPTALFIDEAARYIAALDFLARRGIKVPEHVSLVSNDDDPALAWCHPGIARMPWDPKPIIRRVVRWVNAVRKGKVDRRAITFPAEFVPGGSTGPVWKG
ncbi:MAG: substrate-binding domain-containing protein [Verrucomicrobia bacterium]|nr:substrate-binding domain-containing protein [Verrucomicrobiota bacterium]